MKVAKLINKKNILPALYIKLGFLIFASLIIIINTHVIHLKVETAVVSAPIETITAPLSGFIHEMYVTPGTPVTKNMPLIKLENMDLEKDLQMARINVEDAKLNIAYFQNILSNEEQKLTIYESIGSDRLTSAKAMVASAIKEVSVTKKNLDRLKQLHNKHYISDMTWESAQENMNIANEKLKSNLAQMSLETHSLNSVQQGMYFTGNKLEGKENDLHADINAAIQRLKISEEKVKAYENMANKLILHAPFDGVITKILRSTGNTVDNTKPILLIEQSNTKKQIYAYLTQSEIMYLRLKDKVKIYLPSLNKIFHGRILELNRTEGFIDEIKAQYQWRNINLDRSALAIIEIEDRDQNKFNQLALAGLPAIVYFPRKFTFF